jgi:predicted homoserine dehydrogenase-like protein
MIIIDKLLEKREAEGNPIRVGLIGAGEMAKGLVNQIERYTPGMEVAAISNRTLRKAIEAYRDVGVEPKVCGTLASLQQCLDSGMPAVAENADWLCEAAGLDILVEATGTVEFAARVTLKAIRNGRHMLWFNPEVDATVGPILKEYADRAGVMLGGADGDQPGVIMNLYRWVKSLGLKPLLCGNIKGFEDHYRNPATQAGFAAQWGLSGQMVTSFADGTKISIEQACVANATGMGVAKRGMLGFHHDGHIDEMVSWYDASELERLGGIVDYVVGPKPGPGVFVYASTNDPKTKHFLRYGKLGDGPLYSFYTPYHLIYFEVPHSIARMVLLNDLVMSPLAGPVVEVVAIAKTPLAAGRKLDGIGGYDTYGQCENAAQVHGENLLPIGLVEGAVLRRDIPQDQALTFDDVELPEDSLVCRLYQEQTKRFFGKSSVGAAAVV